MNNPLQRSAFDIKNWLFNKKDWANAESEKEREISSLEKYRKTTFKSNIIQQIMEMFHFLMELRQSYLMNNLVEHFYIDIFKNYENLNLSRGEEQQRLAIKDMVRDMKSVIINDDEYALKIPYRFPSIDYMYKFTRSAFVKNLSENDQIDMHDDFKMLIIDTFNVSFRDKNLKQNTLTLLVRFFSEKTEFIRNIEKMMLVFNDDEWNFYKWANYAIDRFTRNVDKSALWLKEDDEFEDFKYIKKTHEQLEELLGALYHKYETSPDPESDGYKIKFLDKDRAVNEFSQRIYRNLKIYDHLISFITNNKKLLKLVRTFKDIDKNDESSKKAKFVKDIFRKCLNILEGMVLNNPENKEIMWKYREYFVFPELESSTQDGELNLVLAIMDENAKIISERSLTNFINNLHKRISNKTNFVLLLEIYNRIINYESGDSVKSFMLKIVSNRPQMLDGDTQDNLDDYIASVNAKEVLLNILFGSINGSSGASSNPINSALAYSIDTFITSFPISEMLSKIENSMETFDLLITSKNDDEYIDEDSLCDREQKTIIMLYASMYLNKNSEHFNPLELIRYYYQTFLPKYEYKIDKILNGTVDPAKVKMSEAKLLTSNLPILWKKMKFVIGEINTKYDERYKDLTEYIELLEGKFYTIDTKLQKLVFKLRNSNTMLSELFKDFREYEEFEEFREDEDDTSEKTAKVANEGQFKENGMGKLTKLVSLAKRSLVEKKIKHNKIASKQAVTEASLVLHSTWDQYVSKIMASKGLNSEIKSLSNNFSEAIFKELTDINDEVENYNVYSFKVFLTNALEYI